MENEKKQKRQTRLGLLNGFIFLLGSFAFFGDYKIILGLITGFAGLLNIATIFKLKHKYKIILKYAVLILNIIVALMLALDYYMNGTDYLHFVWVFVAVMSFTLLIIYFIKDRRRIEAKDK